MAGTLTQKYMPDPNRPDAMREYMLGSIPQTAMNAFAADGVYFDDPERFERTAAWRAEQPRYDMLNAAPFMRLTGSADKEAGGLFATGGNMRLINDGQLVGTATTPEEMLALGERANALGAQGGRKANLMLQRQDGDQWHNVFQNAPDEDVLGNVLKIAAPIALQFVPGFGQALGAKLGLSGLAAKMAGVGLTSALGRSGAGLIAGDPLGDSLSAGLKAGALSGATAGLMGATGLDKALGSAAGGKGALGPMPEIDYAGLDALAAGKGAIPGGVLEPMATVTAAKLGGLGGALAAAPGSVMNLTGANEVLGHAPSSEEEMAEVTGQRYNPALSAMPPAVAGSVPDRLVADGSGREIEVQNRAPDNQGLGIVAALPVMTGAELPVAPFDPASIPAQPATDVREPNLGDKLKGLTPMQKLALLGAGLNLLGGLGGTKQDAPQGGGPIGPVSRNPTFSAPLPQAGSLFQRPGGGTGGGQPFTGNWNRYGMDYAQQSFDALRARAPSGGAQPLPFAAQSLPAAQMLAADPAGYVRDPMQFARGGGVNGPGGPREDAIPALLSDGEYVIDAETVALLGDGSTEKGAQRLDEFRSNVRRHKGEHLARGKFSADAMPPERYLKQGTK